MMVIMTITKGRRAWQVAEAKAKLSELLTAAAEQPQLIERRGTAVAVVMGIEAYVAANAVVVASSADSRMQRFLECSAALRAGGGVTLRVGRRTPRRSPFEDG